MKNELERLQFVARNYNALQGWPIASAGALFLIYGACVMLWGMSAINLIYGWLALPSLALMALGCSLAIRRHQRKFGTVKNPVPARRNLALAIYIGLYFALIRMSGPDFKNWNVSLEPTIVNAGIILIFMSALPTFPWRHYAIFGLLLIGVGLLPAFGIVSVEQLWHGWTFVLPGIAAVCCAIVDRLILARYLASSKLQESHV